MKSQIESKYYELFGIEQGSYDAGSDGDGNTHGIGQKSDKERSVKLSEQYATQEKGQKSEAANEANDESNKNDSNTGDESSFKSGAGSQNNAGEETETEDEHTETERDEDSQQDAETEKEDGRSAKNAERRRKQEQRRKEAQQKAIDAAVQKALEEERKNSKKMPDSFVTSLGLKEGKLTPEHIRRIVADMPEVKRAAEIAQAAEKTKTASEDEAAIAAIEEDIRKINRLDKSIETIEDFVKMPNHGRFYELVKRGNTFYDAYCLANMDRLMDMSVRAEKRKAINMQQSKEHLKQKFQRGQGPVTVPPDVMMYYKELMPDATESEIQKHYNKMQKK